VFLSEMAGDGSTYVADSWRTWRYVYATVLAMRE